MPTLFEKLKHTFQDLYLTPRIRTVVLVVTTLGSTITWIVSTGDSVNKLVAEATQAFEIDAFFERSPVTLGSTFEEVHKVLGSPTGYSKLGEEYFSLGITVFPKYGEHNVVGGLMASQLPSGIAFEGRLNGIKLGMSFAQVRSKLGNPSFWGTADAHPPIALWKQGDNLTIAYFPIPRTNNTSTVTHITYCKQSSVAAYHAIVSVALQELRAGRILEYFNELREYSDVSDIAGGLTFDQFRDHYSQLSYEIVAVTPNSLGGADVELLYDNDDLIIVWIYPLDWEKPSIRLIHNRGTYLLEKATNNKERQAILNKIRSLRSTATK